MHQEPRDNEQPAEARKDTKERPRRFRIVKLEERIAPAKGGDGQHTNGLHPCYPCQTSRV